MHFILFLIRALSILGGGSHEYQIYRWGVELPHDDEHKRFWFPTNPTLSQPWYALLLVEPHIQPKFRSKISCRILRRLIHLCWARRTQPIRFGWRQLNAPAVVLDHFWGVRVFQVAIFVIFVIVI
jgi:hypothetical protein